LIYIKFIADKRWYQHDIAKFLPVFAASLVLAITTDNPAALLRGAIITRKTAAYLENDSIFRQV